MFNRPLTVIESRLLERDIIRRANDKGIKVVISDDVDGPAASKDTVFLPPLNATGNTTQDDLARWKAWAIHEPLHIRRQSTAMQEKYLDGPKDQNSVDSLLFNVVEDEIMELEHSLIYRGDRQDLSHGRSVIMDEILDLKSESTRKSVTESTMARTVITALGAALHVRREWDAESTVRVDEYCDLLDAKGKEKLQVVLDSGVMHKILEGGDPERAWAIAQELKDIMWTEEEEQQHQEEQQAQANGEGDKEGEEGNEESPAPMGEIHWEDLLFSEHIEPTPPAEGGRIDWTGKPRDKDKLVLYPEANTNYHDFGYTTPEIESYIAEWGWHNDSVDDKALANQTRRLVQSSRRASFSSERLQGKIHGRNLYRVAVPTVGDGEWNRRIFRVRKEKEQVNTCVSIVVDWSGSMSGNKMVVAANCAAALNGVFSNTLRIPLEILSFSETGNVEHAIIKPFSEQRVDNSTIINRFGQSKWVQLSGGNADADAVVWAYERIRTRKEKRKLIFVLSDGSPADTYGYTISADNNLRTAISEVKATKQVELYGIGIMDSNVKRYYGENAQVVNDLSDLQQALIETLKHVVYD